MKNWIEVTVKTTEEFIEILTAELFDLEFDMFEEFPEGIKAYIAEEKFRPNLLEELKEQYQDLIAFTFLVKTIPSQNWNKIRESNLEPIIIADQCLIRAPFHKIDKKYPHEITIDPSMTFGTGHHETTTLMAEKLLELDLEEKFVADVGCGTGILAILASLKGASGADACDIDERACENTELNTRINGCSNINVFHGIFGEVLADRSKYDLIIANINRNVLLDEIPGYADRLLPGGLLLMSGFYSEDLPMIQACSEKEGLRVKSVSEKKNWVGVVFTR